MTCTAIPRQILQYHPTVEDCERRIAELEAENERLCSCLAELERFRDEYAWKPWPPDMRDGRRVLALFVDGNKWVVIVNASYCSDRSIVAYRELPVYVPPEGKP